LPLEPLGNDRPLMRKVASPHERRCRDRRCRLRPALALSWLLAAPLAQAQVAPAPAPTFEVARYVVEGNSLLDPARVDSILAPRTGAARSFTDLRAAAAALQLAYAEAGYGAVKVLLPEQRLDAGTVRIVVVEARLRAPTIQGNTVFDAANIRRSLPALQEGTSPNTIAIARDLRLANENPAKRVNVDLRSDASGDAVEALVSVLDEKPWKAGAVLDTTGTPATGRLRSGVFLQHANVLDRDHVLTLQYITSPEHRRDVSIGALNYRIPLYGSGDSVDLYGIYADVNSGVVGDLFTVRGSGSVVGFRYNQGLTPSADYRHRLTYGFEFRDFDNRVNTVSGSGDLVPDVAVHPLSLGYSATWNGERRQVDYSLSYVRNLPGGSRGRAADIGAARAGASASYSILRWSASYLQALPLEWQVRLAADGQYTRDSLISGEQFGIGGQDSVRGFFEREITNDTGQRVTLELQTPDFGARLGSGVAANALVFYDVGRVARNRALPGEVSETSVASAGIGLRFALAPHYNFRVDIARIARGTGRQAAGDESVNFSLAIAY
jgi:hemolysin activation/secretion protein